MRIIHTLDEMTETARGWLGGWFGGVCADNGIFAQGTSITCGGGTRRM